MLARHYVAGEPHRPTHSDIEKMVASLPYGQWVCADGRVVIFNRRYSPLWERLPDGTVQRADPGEWVRWIKQSWFDLAVPATSAMRANDCVKFCGSFWTEKYRRRRTKSCNARRPHAGKRGE
jgi:hypothetical protein